MSFDEQCQKGWETEPLQIEPCPHIKLGYKVQRNLVGAGFPRPSFTRTEMLCPVCLDKCPY